jgi:hypothetical protein
MERISRLLIAACCALLLAGLCSCSGGGKEEPGLFVSKEAGFSIKYPEQWVIYSEVGSWMPAVEGESPPEGDEDGFSEYVAVDVETVPARISLDEYFDQYHNKLAAESMNYEKHEDGEVDIGGREWKYILYDKEMPEAWWRVLAYVTVRNGKGYAMSCAAENRQFSRHQQTLIEIAHTFEFE